MLISRNSHNMHIPWTRALLSPSIHQHHQCDQPAIRADERPRVFRKLPARIGDDGLLEDSRDKLEPVSLYLPILMLLDLILHLDFFLVHTHGLVNVTTTFWIKLDRRMDG